MHLVMRTGVGRWSGPNYAAATVVETPVSLWHVSGTVDFLYRSHSGQSNEEVDEFEGGVRRVNVPVSEHVLFVR